MLYTKIPLEWRESLENTNATLAELNAKLVTLHSPTIAFICLLMIVGVAGNIVVLYIYRKHKSSTHRCFILWLGVIDLVACTCGMPLLLYSMLNPYMFQAEAACKVLRFMHQFLIDSSGFIVMAMAFERHKMICYLFSSKITPRHVTRFCIGSLILGAISSIPAPIFYGDATVQTGVSNITGTECFVKDSFSESSLPSIYNIALLVLVLVCIVYLCATYILIARVLWKHRKFKENHAYSKSTFVEEDIKKREDSPVRKIRTFKDDTATDSTLTETSTSSTDQTPISSNVSSNGKHCPSQICTGTPSATNTVVDWSYINPVSLDDEADMNAVKDMGDETVRQSSLEQSDNVIVGNKVPELEDVETSTAIQVDEFVVGGENNSTSVDEDKSVVKDEDSCIIEEDGKYTGSNFVSSEMEHICDIQNPQNALDSDTNKISRTEIIKDNNSCEVGENHTELDTIAGKIEDNALEMITTGETDIEAEAKRKYEAENIHSDDTGSNPETVIRETDVDVTIDDANCDTKVEKYDKSTNRSNEKYDDTISETDLHVQNDRKQCNMSASPTDSANDSAELAETSIDKTDGGTNKTSEVPIAQKPEVPIAQNLGRTVRMIHEEREQIEDTEQRLMKRSKRKNSMFNFSIKFSKKKVDKYRFKQIQITKTLAFITFMFIISFIPHLIVMIMITMMPEIMDDASAAEIIVYNFFLRSIVINSMANPIIYGFFDEKFRKECATLLKKTFCFMLPQRPLIR